VGRRQREELARTHTVPRRRGTAVTAAATASCEWRRGARGGGDGDDGDDGGDGGGGGTHGVGGTRQRGVAAPGG